MQLAVRKDWIGWTINGLIARQLREGFSALGLDESLWCRGSQP